jgi:hypothetical protein
MSNLSNRYRDENGAIERKADEIQALSARVTDSISRMITVNPFESVQNDWHLRTNPPAHMHVDNNGDIVCDEGYSIMYSENEYGDMVVSGVIPTPSMVIKVVE